jgi:hypothetical protein
MAQSVIGALRVNLGLDAAQFQRGARQAEGIASRLGRQMQQMGAAISVVGAGIAAAIGSQVRAASDMGRMAAIANTSVEQFQRWAAATGSVGIEAGRLSDILKDVSDRVGDFLTTGGGPMADFFENVAPLVGVTAEQFRNLSGADALQLYVDSLEAANLSQNEMVFYLEAMASDASALIPLLRNGGAEIGRLGDAAERAGGIMSAETVAGARAFTEELRQTGIAVRGIVQQIMAALLPAMVAVAEIVRTAAASFANMTPATQTFIAGVSAAVVVIGPLLIAVGTLTRAMAALRLASFAALGPWGVLAALVATAAAAFTRFGSAADPVEGTLDSVREAQDELNRALGVFAETGAPAAQEEAVTLARRLEAEALAALSAAQAHREVMLARVQAAEGMGDGGATNPMIGQIRRDLEESEARILEILEQVNRAREAASVFITTVGGGAPAVEEVTAEAERLVGTLDLAGASAGHAAEVDIPEMTKALQDAADAAGQLQNSFESAFVNAVTGTEGLRGALAGLARDLARMAAQAAFRGMFGNLFGGGGGGGFLSGLAGLFSVGPRVSMATMPSFAGGGYTGSGSRSGGMDGRGGFLAMMHPNETVIDHTRGQSGGEVLVRVVVSEAPGFASRVDTIATGSAARVVTEYDRDILPESVQRVSQDPMRRG